jgi:phenylpropionate dioxygenase-like ring-hydroxylating dioxygenase large terminal subunit
MTAVETLGAPVDDLAALAGTSDGASSAAVDPWRRYWHPVGWVSGLGAAPTSTLLLGERVVLWRTSDAVVHAAVDRCVHRGTALSLGEVVDDCLVCPYHGWRYDASGACVAMPQLPPGAAIPARARLTDLRCEVRYGLVWVALDEPVADIPAFPEWDDPTYRHVECPAYTWASSAPRMVENFTDFGHLGWLHDGYLGTRDDLVVPPHTVTDAGGELRYELTMQVPNTNAEFAVTDVAGAIGTQTNTYVLTLPHAIWLQCTYHDTGTHRTLFFAAQPRTATEATGYCYQSRDFDLDGADQDYADFQDLLAEQDRPIVESQLPHELPLALAAELHLPFDRVAIAYRRARHRVEVTA